MTKGAISQKGAAKGAQASEKHPMKYWGLALKTWAFTIGGGVVFRRDEYTQVKSFQRLKMIQHAWIQENARQEVMGAASGKTGRLGGLLRHLDL